MLLPYLITMASMVVSSRCSTSSVCRDPGTPEHGSRECLSCFASGNVVKFQCDPGYTMAGRESILCQEDGTWNGRKPECEPVSCPEIRPPRHGTRDGDQTEYPANVTFTCHPGYEMNGEAEISCQATRRWSAKLPTCTACREGYYRSSSESKCTQCPLNSTTSTYASTSRQLCTCMPGSYGPQGGPCKVINCSALPDPPHGKIFACATTQNSQCEAACDAGYTWSGGSRWRTCTDDGWTGTDAKCTVCPRNTYRMQSSGWVCQRCPWNRVTRPDRQPATSKDDCVCESGYKSFSSDGPCNDENECNEGNGGCSQRCENLPGSYRCSCSVAGYDLDTDGRTCLKTRSCPELLQRPSHGELSCSYTESTNGHICHIFCDRGYYFVSGENSYLTCGGETSFEWSHRTVNSTARIPSCTREVFFDMNIPVTLKYQSSTDCTSTGSSMQPFLEEAINTIAQCRSKCRIDDVTVICNASLSNMEANFDITVFNPHPGDVPLNCTEFCQRTSLIQMLRDSFSVVKGIKNLIEQKTKLQLSHNGAPSIDIDETLKPPGYYGKIQPLCQEGHVLTKRRLCVPCDKGFYLPQRSLTSCLPCPKGSYQMFEGRTRCDPCLPGSTTLDVATDHSSMCNQREEIKAETDHGEDVTEENAEAILDNPLFGL